MSVLVFVESRPCCSDSALDFQCLLLVERDSLSQIFRAFVLCQYFDAHFTDFNVSFCVRIHGALVAENLRLVWVGPETHFIGCFLEFTHHVPQLFFGGCEEHHVVGKSQVEALSVLVAQVNSHSFFFFLHRSHLVSVNFPQEADALVIDIARFECLPMEL